MRAKIQNNKMFMEFLQLEGTGILPEMAFLQDVRMIYEVDKDKKRTDKVIGVRYDCIGETEFSTFSLKTLSVKPVITKEELEASEEPVRISIPVSECIIKPYKIEYGQATVTITAPYVRLVKEK